MIGNTAKNQQKTKPMAIHPVAALRLLARTEAAVKGDLTRALEAIADDIENYERGDKAAQQQGAQ